MSVAGSGIVVCCEPIMLPDRGTVPPAIKVTGLTLKVNEPAIPCAPPDEKVKVCGGVVKLMKTPPCELLVTLPTRVAS
jgi:hypothetical protein